VPSKTSDSVLDAPTTLGAMATAAGDNAFPKGHDDPLWRRDQIDTTRWHRLFPYQFLVVEAVPGPRDTVLYKLVPGWRFTLPMPPESLVFDRTYAINLGAQNHGVLEEHNGLVFVPIQLHGTCGVLPLRGAAEQQPGATPLGSIAAGTVQAVQGAQAALQDLQRTATSSPMVSSNIHPADDFAAGGALAKSSGYYQTRLLGQFLDAYATMKRDRRFRARTLAFCTWKDEAVYLVKPSSLRLAKTASAPLEYTYDLSLVAWASVKLDAGNAGTTDLQLPIRRNPGLLNQVLNLVQSARRVLAATSNVASSALGDVDRLITEPLRETALFCKDLQGTVATVADLPKSLVEQVRTSFATAAASAAGFPDQQDARTRSQLRSAAAAGVEMGASSRLAPRPGGPDPGSDHPVAKLDYGALDAVSVDSLALPPETARRLAAERARVASLSRDDFATRRDRLRAAADRLAVAIGAGNTTFEDTFAVTAPRIKAAPSDADWDTLFALADAAAALDHLAATADPPAGETVMESMAALAQRSGLAFRVPKSKFAVPFPHGATIERVAQLYLGDPLRWLEIVTLNGLQAPFVDEHGWSTALIVPGVDTEACVAVGSIPDVYVGQTVYLRSQAVRRVHRRVVAVEVDGDILRLQLDGPTTDYTVHDGALLEGFLPGTVNSQQLVYIPSDEAPADEPAVTRTIPGVGEFDPLVAVGGVDLLLDSDNEIVFTPDGDTPFAIGLQNMIQNWRVLLATPLGAVLLHPEEGRPQAVGRSTADVSAGEDLRAVQRMFAEDPGVEGVTGLRVVKSGSAETLSATIHVRGVKQPIPVNYEIDTGARPPDPLG